MILVLDYGGRGKELAARMIRKAGCYSEIRPGNMTKKAIKAMNPIGIVSVSDGKPGSVPRWLAFETGVMVMTVNGGPMDDIASFVKYECKSKCEYNIDNYIKWQLEAIKTRTDGEDVLLALSGGVDSSVCAALLSKAIPGRVHCIFVDHGFIRENEGDQVEAAFSGMKLDFIRVDAQDRFLAKIKGIEDPEAKRRIIGAEFIEVFKEEAKKLGNIKYLAQGTIYPDIVESNWNGTTVKSHHNVGGLPAALGFKELVEPLSGLFKDEVRELGRKLKLSKAFVERQPFPGPGLSVRVIGAVTKEKLFMLRRADAIFREEIETAIKKPEDRPGQYFAVHTGINAVGVKEGARTYGAVIALRAVDTRDYMTAEYTQLPHGLLARAAARILSDVPGAGRVVYDITSKPPGTIEFE
jgi:GMP synthase (glutamine-hydrolysing)